MRELSATITRTALSACAGLVCTLTTARIGRSSWRREILGHVPLGYVRREDNLFEGQKQNPRRSDDSSTSVRVYRNAVTGTSIEVRDVRDRVHIAKTCNMVQSFAGMKRPLSWSVGDGTHVRLGSRRGESPRAPVSLVGSII